MSGSQISGRTVLVTGGAKRLGAAIARALAGAGHRVVIHYGSSEDDARALADEVGAAGTVQGDLADTHIIDDLFARARCSGRCDRWAGEFGVGLRIRFTCYDRSVACGAVACGQPARPALLTAALAAQEGLEDGAVVNLLDQKVANLNPDFFSYTCTKLALAGATTMLAQAFAPRVRVNAVSPGLTLPSADQSATAFDRVARENLLRRPVGADAVVEAVVYLLGAKSVTGQNLFVDAGQRFLKRDGDVMFEERIGRRGIGVADA